MTETADNRRPGDLTKDELIDRIIRVDHAGEFGAKRIYEGQLAVLRGKPEAHAIEHMYTQEMEHLRAFSADLHMVLMSGNAQRAAARPVAAAR